MLNSGRITANAGTGIQPSAKGMLAFGTPRVERPSLRARSPAGERHRGVGGTSAQLGYVLTPGPHRRLPVPTQPTDGTPLPACSRRRHVAADAGPAGVIPLQVEGEQVAARVVGVVQRFPSIVGDAVIADRVQHATALDTRSPGLGTTNELWLTSDRASDACPHAVVQSRADTLAARLAGRPARARGVC